MEGKEFRPPVEESLLEGLSREKRVKMAEKLISHYEDFIRTKIDEIVERRIQFRQEQLDRKDAPLIMNNLSYNLRSVAEETASEWNDWVREKLLKLKGDEVDEALEDLGMTPLRNNLI